MLLSNIDKLFRKVITAKNFKKSIYSEVEEYKNNLKTKGKSSPIYLDEDVSLLKVGIDEITFLCDNFLNQEIDKWELNYVVEALLLSDRIKFESETIQDSLDILGDVDVLNNIDDEYVKDVLKGIKGS